MHQTHYGNMLIPAGINLIPGYLLCCILGFGIAGCFTMIEPIFSIVQFMARVHVFQADISSLEKMQICNACC